jgi:hypothetical protein
VEPAQDRDRDALEDPVHGDIDRALGRAVLVGKAARETLGDGEVGMAEGRIDLDEDRLSPRLAFRADRVIAGEVLGLEHRRDESFRYQRQIQML